MSSGLNPKTFLSGAVLFLALLALTTVPVSAQEEENLKVFDRWIEWTDGGHMLVHHINSQAFALLDQRDSEIARLQTQADWLKRQEKVRQTLVKIVGPFPERTPLNPKVTGVLKKNGYRVEKILFQSMPNFYVTGCLFIPDGIKGKRPAILNVIGHTDIAFRGSGYQSLIHNLVKKGFIVFAIDPIGQGERLQYYDPEKKRSTIGGPTSEHSYVGNQCFINGSSLARYFTWDGIRAVDYLLTRKEVDPARLGITGISGGGTQTSYIGAMDERIKAAAPTCYITGFRRLLSSIGPQDAEQNMYHAVGAGITHADYLEIRAPRPTLMVTTTRDFFSIQGARETYREVRRAYSAFGKEENIGMVEDDLGHGYTSKNRSSIYAFFQKALDLPGDPADEKLEMLKPEELWVTSTGQLSTSIPNCETAFSVNKKEAEKLVAGIEESRKNIESHLSKVREKARDISGYLDPEKGGEPVFRGRYQRQGYNVEMYAIQGEGKYVVPLLLFIPSGKGPFPSVIYLHPDGKAADASPGGEIERLVKQGMIVAATDVIGIGETEHKTNDTAYAAVLISRSIPGIQAGDAVRVVNYLKTRQDVAQGQIGVIAYGELCPAALHAAAFDNSIGPVTLIGSLVSYRSIVMNRFYRFPFRSAVAGALQAYDLPDLVACLAPRKVTLSELKDQNNEPAPETLITQELAFPRSVFQAKGVPSNLEVRETR